MSRQARAHFEADYRFLRDVRRFVTARLRSWGLLSLAGDAGLVATELAANAVMHARSAFTVCLKSSDRRVTVEVRDENPREPTLTPSTPGALSGRGLQLVDTLSNSWGVRQIPEDGKVVWAELGDSGAGAPANGDK
jgi:anti-sigma regulatory factor (Ser/Thr protein kinase)